MASEVGCAHILTVWTRVFMMAPRGKWAETKLCEKKQRKGGESLPVRLYTQVCRKLLANVFTPMEIC